MEKRTYWKTITALLCAGWAMIWIYRTMLTTVYAQLQQSIGVQSAARLGLISSCYFIGYVIMQIPGGVLMDKLGKKRVLTPCFLLFAAGAALTGSASTLGMLYLGSAVAGVATGTYYSGAFSLAAELAPSDKRFFVNSIINSGCAAGMIIGYSGSSIVVKSFGGSWRVLPYLVLAGCIILTAAFAFLLRADAPEKETKDLRTQMRFKDILKELISVDMLASYFFYFCTCYGYYMIATWLPSFLENERGFAGSLAGMAASIVAISSIPCALLISRLVDRQSKNKRVYLVVLQLLSALMLVLAVLLRSKAMLIAVIALYGMFGKQAVDPLIVPCVNEQVSEKIRSTGLGVFNCLGMSASILAPFVTGAAVDAMGSQELGFGVAAVLLCVSAILFLLSALCRKKREAAK